MGRVILWPGLGRAARERGHLSNLAAYELLGNALREARDNSGVIAVDDAKNIITEVMGVSSRTLRRRLATLEALGLLIPFRRTRLGRRPHRGHRVARRAVGPMLYRLAGRARLAQVLGVDIGELGEPVEIAATLMHHKTISMAVYEASAYTVKRPPMRALLEGAPPVAHPHESRTRAEKRRLSGVSERRQLDLDRAGASRLLHANYAIVEETAPLTGGGAFYTPDGRLIKRLGDTRAATHITPTTPAQGRRWRRRARKRDHDNLIYGRGVAGHRAERQSFTGRTYGQALERAQKAKHEPQSAILVVGAGPRKRPRLIIASVPRAAVKPNLLDLEEVRRRDGVSLLRRDLDRLARRLQERETGQEPM